MPQLPKLILLPGLDGTGVLFRPLLACLPDDVRHTVIPYPSDQVLSLSEHAQYVAEHLPGEEVVLLAESFSGLVALTLLAQEVPHIKGVIFVASFAEPPRPVLLRLAPMGRWAGSAARASPAFLLRQFCLGRDAGARELALLREALSAVSPAVLAHRLKLVSQNQSFGKERFSAPCYYLQANQDRLVPASAVHWFQRHFQVWETKAVDGPHFLLQAKPQQCAEWIAKKLRNF